MDETFIKVFPLNCDIIHVNLHNTFYQITENTEHTSLECGRGITQAERHPPVGICANMVGEGSLVPIVCNNFNLEVA